MRRYGLRDDQWERIRDLLPGREGHVGVTARDNRLFVEAVLYRYRAGIPWRDLPERFGDWKNVHRRFSRGPSLASGSEYSSISRPKPTTNMRWSTAPLCVPISIAPVPKKSRRGPGDRAIPRRIEHQDPCAGRCSRQSSRPFPDRWTSSRPHWRRSFAALYASRHADRR